MFSPLSFQTSAFSKKIKKENMPNSSFRRKCSDILLPRSNCSLRSEISSPAIRKELPSPRSAAIIRCKDDHHLRSNKNKLLRSLLFLKDAKELDSLFDQKKSSSNQNEKYVKIEEIVSKLEQPNQIDFLSQIKQLSKTQEEIIDEILEKNPQSKHIQQVYSLLKQNFNLEQELEARPTKQDLLVNNEQSANEMDENFVKSNSFKEQQQNEEHFIGGFIENFDYQLNFSSPFTPQPKVNKDFDKENRLKCFTLENSSWKNNFPRTPGTSTPCTTPLLERKRLLSSSKIEDMTDFVPEKKDLFGDFNELLKDFNENEATQWRFEENEEWENKDFKEEDFLA